MRKGYQARTTAGDKTLRLPLPEGVNYEEWLEDSAGYRKYLDEQIEKHPELFPEEIKGGYWLDGLVESKRQQLKTRRILIKSSRQAYQVQPDTVMPYMVGKTEEVEKGLYLRGWGVSYEGIAHVLGKTPMYWYTVTQALGRISIVGSTVKGPDSFPP